MTPTAVTGAVDPASHRPMGANGGRWAWAAISTLGYVASAFGTLVVVGPLEGTGLFAIADPQAHGLGLALWTLTWGILSALIVKVAARPLLDAPLRISPGAITTLGGGLAVASLTQYVLYGWAMARFGYNDPKYIGWTVALPGALVAVAVAGFATQAAPRPADGLPPALALALAAAGVGFIVISNVGGLVDGIRPASVPLALMIGAAGAFTVTVAVVAFEGRRRVASPRAGHRPPD